MPALISYSFGDIPDGFNYNNHNARIVGDVKGQLDDWNWDAALVINHAWLDTTQYGFISYQGLLGAVANGSYNFANPSSNSAAVRGSLAPGYNKTSTTDLDSLDLSANRVLWDMPGGSAGLAVGAQLRHEAQNDPDPESEFRIPGPGQRADQGEPRCQRRLWRTGSADPAVAGSGCFRPLRPLHRCRQQFLAKDRHQVQADRLDRVAWHLVQGFPRARLR